MPESSGESPSGQTQLASPYAAEERAEYGDSTTGLAVLWNLAGELEHSGALLDAQPTESDPATGELSTKTTPFSIIQLGKLSEYIRRQDEHEVPLLAQRQLIPLDDVWWLCGEGYLRVMLPKNWVGLCARVMLASK